MNAFNSSVPAVVGDSPFTFPDTGQPVRSVLIDGEPRFAVVDVCAILGIGNPSDVVRRLHKDDLDTIEVVDNRGQTQTVNAVNESGLYDIILDSRKPEARAFRRWVTSEVLPSIRKIGAYAPALTPAELLVVQAQRLVDQERRTLALESTTRELGDRMSTLESEHGWYTALGYANRERLRGEATYLSRVGKRASKIMDQLGLVPGTCPDRRWGEVKTYPTEVLARAFSEVTPK